MVVGGLEKSEPWLLPHQILASPQWDFSWLPASYDLLSPALGLGLLGHLAYYLGTSGRGETIWVDRPIIDIIGLVWVKVREVGMVCHFAQAAITKYHRLGMLKQHKFVLAQFWGLEIQDKGWKIRFLWRLSPWSADAHFLPVSSRGLDIDSPLTGTLNLWTPVSSSVKRRDYYPQWNIWKYPAYPSISHQV
jgi:hypothetical protein